MHPLYTEWRLWLEGFSDNSGQKLTDGNYVAFLPSSKSFVPVILKLIEESQRLITYQFFGIEADSGGRPIAQALKNASSRGVSVKVMLDGTELFLRTNGYWSFLPFQPDEVRREKAATKAMLKEMEEGGIEIFRYGWKYLHYRHHAKALISDNAFLVIGGFNPTEHNCVWHDVCAVASGPIVIEAQKMFNDVFRRSGKGRAPLEVFSNFESNHGSVKSSCVMIANRPVEGCFDLSHLLLKLVQRAQSSIRIENGYLTDRSMLRALVEAKKRGVATVQVIVPSGSNHPSVDWLFRRKIPKLLEQGIEVYLYPGMTHAKVMAIDDLVVSVGSANLERFSLRYQNEGNLIALDPDGQLGKRFYDEVFAPDLQKSKRVE